MKNFNLKSEVEKIYIGNRRKNKEYQYTVPSPESYPYQWLWDSCFHSIVLSHFDIGAAKEELRSLVSKQFDSGLIPHIIYWERHNIINNDWGAKDTSTFTQPPLLAYTVWQIFKKEKDKEFLQEMFPSLDRFYVYILTRDLREHNLVGIVNPDESGEDNSPRFDTPLGLPHKHTFSENNRKRSELLERNKACNFDATNCMRNFFWVKDVAFNSYLIENLHVMSKIAEELNEEEKHSYYLKKSELISGAMRERMLKNGIFWNIYGSDHVKIPIKTWAIFTPLLAGILSDEEAKNLIKNHLLNEEEFWSAYPIPSTAMNEESFFPIESDEGPAWLHPNWRGPVWMASNWFVYRGLKKYGFEEEAQAIKDRSTELLEKSGFREYYNPQTGAGLGAKDFTWGGLVLDMN